MTSRYWLFLSPCSSPSLPQGSVESRLLTSVFYDFGKSLSGYQSSAPGPDPKSANDYFMAAFRQFIDSLPNLRLNDRSFASQEIETGSRKFSFLTYARMSARNGFHYGMKARLKSQEKMAPYI